MHYPWFVRVLKSPLQFPIFKALKDLNLSARTLKVLNFVFVKSSLNIKIMVVFITTCHSLVFTYFYIVFYVFIVKVGCSNFSKCILWSAASICFQDWGGGGAW